MVVLTNSGSGMWARKLEIFELVYIFFLDTPSSSQYNIILLTKVLGYNKVNEFMLTAAIFGQMPAF